jgi:hypothetical protein
MTVADQRFDDRVLTHQKFVALRCIDGIASAFWQGMKAHPALSKLPLEVMGNWETVWIEALPVHQKGFTGRG